MNNKYELVKDQTKELYGGNTLYRIRALKGFDIVKAGELGGFVESEANLSHEGTCWIFHNAQVTDSSQVTGSARVYGDARLYGSARVYGSAHVYGDARVYGDVYVYGSACVYGDACVYGSAHVHGSARVYGDVQVAKTPICISGLKHHITITETHILVGCEWHTIEHWRKEIVNIGRKNGYTDDEIKQVIKVLKALLPKREKKS